MNFHCKFQCERMSGELQSKNEELDKVRSELHLANLEKHKVREVCPPT